MIRYPFEAPPAFGELTEIAPGILWLRVPLPMALDHVNVYLLRDADGWTLVDTGLKTSKVTTMWEAVVAQLDAPITRVVLTHHHPDHVGYAGWFMEQGAELVTTRTAYLTARMLTLDAQDRYTPQQQTFYKRAGMDGDVFAARIAERPFNFADVVHPIPLGYQRIAEGDMIEIGGRSWQVHVGHGHAPEHATLWSTAGEFALTGDQIIPSISSNIGVYPTEPEANPLAEWLDSCAQLQAHAQDGQLALCGHKLPFIGIEFRLQQLIDNHLGVLDRLRAALRRRPSTAGEVFTPIFKREISGGAYGLALVEAYAHCQYLYHAGEARRDLNADGAWVYTLI